MRIAIGSMMHESNTFNKLTTGLETFNLADGDEFLQVQGWKGTVIDGIYNTLKEAGAEIGPMFFARAIPSGAVRLDAYEYIKARMIDKLRRSGPWDGVCLALHGSMAVEGLYDPEGDLLEAIRWEVGHEIPVVCALDMHATVTERMALLSDGYAAYRTAPHEDEAETGTRAASILLRSLAKGRKTVNAFVKIPLLVSGEQSETRVDPAKSLFEALAGYDALPPVLCASYVMGFPWADSPFGGAGALVTGWADDVEPLKELAKKVALNFWEKRAEFVYSAMALPPEQALQAALAFEKRPVIISDSGDNPTAGASQDTTNFLRLMLESGVRNAVYTCIADPRAYRECSAREIGETFPLTVGGYYSGKESERLSLSAELIARAESQGTAYAVMRARGVTFVVSNGRCATYDPRTLRGLGLAPETYDLIAIKAGYLSPEYQAMSELSILAHTKGDTALELRRLPYVKTPRPIYPLDIEMSF